MSRFLAMMAIVFLARSASAGVIRGHVALSRAWSVAAAAAKKQPGVGETVVWLESVPDKVEQKLAGAHGFLFFRKPAPPPRPLRMVQSDERFRPRVLAAVAGQSVAFVNTDRVYHNAFSVSPARRFDVGKHAPGSADTVAFSRPGVVNVHCDIHPQETAFIVVVPNHAVVRPDSTGHFELPKLPEGRYTLHAWSPERGELKRVVNVPRKGDATLDLVY